MLARPGLLGGPATEPEDYEAMPCRANVSGMRVLGNSDSNTKRLASAMGISALSYIEHRRSPSTAKILPI
jgi:hypothetical protein